jgi:hypothetical protein
MSQASGATFKIPQLTRRAARSVGRATPGRATPGQVLASGTGRAATRGGGEVIELEYGITVYPAREEKGRWRAVWYENGGRRQPVGPAASPRWPAPRWHRSARGHGRFRRVFPVTDRGQALLRCGPGVEPVAALLEVAYDALAMLDGVGVVVLELGVHPQHRQPDVAALGLETSELGGEALRLARGSSTTVGRHANCTAAW